MLIPGAKDVICSSCFLGNGALSNMGRSDRRDCLLNRLSLKGALALCSRPFYAYSDPFYQLSLALLGMVDGLCYSRSPHVTTDMTCPLCLFVETMIEEELDSLRDGT
jgi:hypothetical protein